MEKASFPQFSKLPAELRLCIWEAAVSSPSMHLFDLCLPVPPADDADIKSTQEWNRARTAFSRARDSGRTAVPEEAVARYNTFKNTVFLDARCNTDSNTYSQLDDESSRSSQSRSDPSMYRWRMALGASCSDAFRATSISSVRAWGKGPIFPVSVFGNTANTVYLPGPDRRIQYNNRTDVMHLCLPPQQTSSIPTALPTANDAPLPPSSSRSACRSCSLPLKNSTFETEPAESQQAEDVPMGLLDAQWSDEMAEALRNARHVAIDAAQTKSYVDMSGPLAAEEIAMLACTLHQGLEVLYLVDYCPGRCQNCARPAISSKDLIQQHDRLYTKLHSTSIVSTKCEESTSSIDDKDIRDPDVICGVNMVYREVFGLEQLGWSDSHPAFIFGRALGEAIRAQQLDATQACQFRGVRVLVAEDE